jgi:uncharacterized protein
MLESVQRALRALARLPAWALLGLIWLYQRLVSPVLPAVLGPSCGCRFYPTCSHYAAEAVRTHGALRGAWFAVRRLARCTPRHSGGFDPVPPPTPRRAPICARMKNASLRKNARPTRHERTRDQLPCLPVSSVSQASPVSLSSK